MDNRKRYKIENLFFLLISVIDQSDIRKISTDFIEFNYLFIVCIKNQSYNPLKT